MIWLLFFPIPALLIWFFWYSRKDEPVGKLRREIRNRHRGEQRQAEEPPSDFRFNGPTQPE